MGCPITFHRRPSVGSPTGTEIGAPVSTTSTPRASPSVESIATARTRSSPRCCCTSATSVPSPSEISRAVRISGRRSGKTASSTTPLISMIFPTLVLATSCWSGMGLLKGFAWLGVCGAKAPQEPAHRTRVPARLVPGPAALLTTQRRRHTGVVVEPSDVRGDEVRAGEDYEPSGVAGTWICTLAAQ